MQITLEGATLYVVVVLLVVIVSILVVTAVVREWTRQRVNKENKDRELLGAIQSVHAAMTQICERVQSRAEIEKDNYVQVLSEFHEMSTLVLDVERRLAKQLEENRSLLRERHDGTHIYNSQSDGGQTNQGGKVKGDQR